MKFKLIVLLVLMVLAFAGAIMLAWLEMDAACSVSLLFVVAFIALYILDDPSMLGYCIYSQPYMYFP